MIEILNDNIGFVKKVFKPIKDIRDLNDNGYIECDKDLTVGEFKEIDFKKVSDVDFVNFLTQGIRTTGATSKLLNVPISRTGWFNQTFCQRNATMPILVSTELYNELEDRQSFMYQHFRNLKTYIEYTYNVLICSRRYLKNNQYAYVDWSLYHKEYK